MGTGNRDQDTKDIVIIETLVTPFPWVQGTQQNRKYCRAIY